MKTILLAEDNTIVRMTLVEVLGQFGFNVIEAEDGSRALELFNEHPEIVIIIADIQMPGMDGDRLIVEIKKQRPNLPCILMSGSEAPADHKADKFLLKPPHIDELRQTIEELIL